MPRKIIEIEDIEPEQEKKVSKPIRKPLSPERIKQRLEMLAKGRKIARDNAQKRIEALSKQTTDEALAKQPPIPIPIPEPIPAPEEAFDIRGMIRDVVRSEMLSHTGPPILLPRRRSQSRRQIRKLYDSTDTETNIETKPIKPIKTHNKPLPMQVAIPQSKVELPIPLLKRPEYNIMQDIFGHSN